MRCDTGFNIETFYVKQMSPLLPLFTPFGRTVRGKAPLRLLALGIPYSGTLRYDMTLVLALRFLHKYMSIVLPPFVTPFGVVIRGKATLVSPYSRKPKVAMSVILTLALLHQ